MRAVVIGLDDLENDRQLTLSQTRHELGLE
jgi:hypothetical protein